MKLTSEDKKILTNWGYLEADFAQIERAINKTIYTMNGMKITADQTVEILGKETYLSGISRSAFHWSCGRENKEGQYVSFDSSKLFK